jgi:hypothetical protein
LATIGRRGPCLCLRYVQVCRRHHARPPRSRPAPVIRPIFNSSKTHTFQQDSRGSQGKVGGGPVSRSFLSVSFRTLNLPLFFSGACRPSQHRDRGSRSLKRTLAGGKKSLDKHWQPCRRCEKLFNSVVPNNNTASHTLSTSTEASRDHRTKKEIDAVLPWVRWFGLLILCFAFSDTFFNLQASRIVAKYPFRPLSLPSDSIST